MVVPLEQAGGGGWAGLHMAPPACGGDWPGWTGGGGQARAQVSAQIKLGWWNRVRWESMEAHGWAPSPMWRGWTCLGAALVQCPLGSTSPCCVATWCLPTIADSHVPWHCGCCWGLGCVWWPEAAGGGCGEAFCAHTAWAGRAWLAPSRGCSQPGSVSVHRG